MSRSCGSKSEQEDPVVIYGDTFIKKKKGGLYDRKYKKLQGKPRLFGDLRHKKGLHFLETYAIV